MSAMSPTESRRCQFTCWWESTILVGAGGMGERSCAVYTQGYLSRIPLVNPHMSIPPSTSAPRVFPLMGLGECLIGEEEKQLVMEALDRKQLFRYYGLGGAAPLMVATLEKEFAAGTGTRFAQGVTSGTAA